MSDHPAGVRARGARRAGTRRARRPGSCSPARAGGDVEVVDRRAGRRGRGVRARLDHEGGHGAAARRRGGARRGRARHAARRLPPGRAPAGADHARAARDAHVGAAAAAARVPPPARLHEPDRPVRGIDRRRAARRPRARARPRRRRMRYSNFGAALLGQALAARAGTPYEELVHERVLAPLGVEEVWARGAPDVVQPHDRRGRPVPPWTHGRLRAGRLPARHRRAARSRSQPRCLRRRRRGRGRRAGADAARAARADARRARLAARTGRPRHADVVAQRRHARLPRVLRLRRRDRRGRGRRHELAEAAGPARGEGPGRSEPLCQLAIRPASAFRRHSAMAGGSSSDVLDVRRDRPAVAERVAHRAGAVAVDVVGDRVDLGRARPPGPARGARRRPRRRA